MTVGTATAREAQKRLAAEAAVAEIQPGMIVGLGTGTTAAYAIDAAAARRRQGLAFRAVATSLATARAAQAARIVVIDFAGVAAIDLCIDGVDEIDPALHAIKGGGGAMLREKIVASSAARMIAIADDSKPVARLGARPVPIEVLPFAVGFVAARVQGLDGAVTRRVGEDGAAFFTDQGNAILDCRFAALDDPAGMARALAAIPGLLGHGLFLDEIDALYLGTDAGVVRRDRTGPMIDG